jgi:hypothetical protein
MPLPDPVLGKIPLSGGKKAESKKNTRNEKKSLYFLFPDFI